MAWPPADKNVLTAMYNIKEKTSVMNEHTCTAQVVVICIHFANYNNIYTKRRKEIMI